MYQYFVTSYLLILFSLCLKAFLVCLPLIFLRCYRKEKNVFCNFHLILQFHCNKCLRILIFVFPCRVIERDIDPIESTISSLYSLKAHLHHYLQVDGMEQSLFSEAASSLSSLIEDYHRLDATKGRLVPDAPRLDIAS